MTPEEIAQRRAERVALNLVKAIRRFDVSRTELSGAIFDLSMILEQLMVPKLPHMQRLNELMVRLELQVREVQGAHSRVAARHSEAYEMTARAVFTRELYPRGDEVDRIVADARRVIEERGK